MEDKNDRKTYQADYYAKNKAKIAERKKAALLAKQDEENAAQKERYHNDPEYRESRRNINAKAYAKRARLAESDPAQRQKQDDYNAIRRERYKERSDNPEQNESRQNYEAKRWQMHLERYENDPEYRQKYDERIEKQNAKRREQRRLKKEKAQAAKAQAQDTNSNEVKDGQ